MGEGTRTLLGLSVLCAIVLVPVIPAYLLFKALPSSATVSGPLKGLHLKLGGAFAGWFAAVLLLIYTKPVWFPASPLPPPAELVWQVTGTVADENGNPVPLLAPGEFDLFESPFVSDTEGNFRLTFTTKPKPNGSGLDFPRLTINHPSMQPWPIDLEQLAVRAGTTDRVLKAEPIRLHPLTAYTGAGVVAEPVH